MAHELLIEDGKAAMFYVDEKPWHGLGTPLAAPPTSEEAIVAARLDWQVVKIPLYLAGGHRLHEVPHRFALVRADRVGSTTCPVFGIAGSPYQPLQNEEAFGFFDPFIRDGVAEYETAGALGKGERVWILAKLRGELQVQEGDNLVKYVLLSNSHDGRSSLQLKLTPVRVVCNNTLTLALSEGGTIRIPHDRNLALGLDRAKSLITRLQLAYELVEQVCRRMANTHVKVAAVRNYLGQVFPMPTGELEQKSANAVDLQRRLALHLALHGKGNEPLGRDPTIWTVYNGVTELIDHRKPALPGPDNSSRRLQSVWFGRGAAVQARAFTLAKEWVDEEAQV